MALVDRDYFYYFDNLGESALSEEIEQDLKVWTDQPWATMYFNRSMGLKLHLRDNAPDSRKLDIDTRKDITEAFGRRNIDVQNTTDNRRNYKAFTSQNVIEIEKPRGLNRGTRNVKILYLEDQDLQAGLKTLNVEI